MRENGGERLRAAGFTLSPSQRREGVNGELTSLKPHPGFEPHQKKKSRSWTFRSALPCLRKRTSSASSAQNSLQKNSPFGARHGCNSPFTIGKLFAQNAQRAATSVSLRLSLICCP